MEFPFWVTYHVAAVPYLATRVRLRGWHISNDEHAANNPLLIHLMMAHSKHCYGIIRTNTPRSHACMQDSYNNSERTSLMPHSFVVTLRTW